MAAAAALWTLAALLWAAAAAVTATPAGALPAEDWRVQASSTTKGIADGGSSEEPDSMEPWSEHVMRVPANARATDLTAGLPEPSLPDLPRLLAATLSRLEADSACGRDSAHFLWALQNFTLWAVRMYDASVKAPNGVLYGSVYQMGHFDQCLSVKTAHVRGQYCLPEIHVSPLTPEPLPSDPFALSFDPEGSAWLQIQFAGDVSKIRRDRLWWALCVPASCSTQQLQRSLAAALRVFGARMRIGLKVELHEDHCTLGDRPPVGTASVIFACAVAVLIVLSAIGTYCENHTEGDIFNPEKKKGCGIAIMECFSVRKNFRDLMSVKNSNPQLDIFAAYRTFFLLCIITGHRLLVYCGYPLFQGEQEDEIFRNPLSMVMGNGLVFVDIFFTIGGFTFGHVLFQRAQKGLKFHEIFLAVVNRYVRLTPLLAFVLLFQSGVLPYLASGPLWKSAVIREQTRCQTNWWTNILYVNNYVDAANICLFQSWYLSADFQYFIVSLFVCYLILRYPVAGWTAMGSLIFLSILTPSMMIYLQNLDALVLPYPDILKNFRETKVFTKMYIASHNRAAPYLIGVVGGIAASQGKLLKKRLSKTATHAAFVLFWIVGLAVLFSAFVFFVPERPYSALENALYGGLNHAATGVLIAFYGFLPVYGGSEKLERFLSAKVLVVVSRLTYAAYLIHPASQLYGLGYLRLPHSFDFYTLIWMTLSDIVTTYLFAVVATVMLDSPCRTLIKLLFQGRK